MTTHPVLRFGDSGEEVKTLQESLSTLGYSPGSIDGIFGQLTLEAVKQFQQANGLVVDGIVGPNTWYTIERKVNELQQQPTTTHPTLRTGDSGEEVKYLQQSLLTLGYSPGPIDGIFGQLTLEAVKQFQQANGLAVDGIVGPNTWYTIEQKLNSNPSPSPDPTPVPPDPNPTPAPTPTEMKPLTITVQYIPGLPLVPYRNGAGNYEGVVSHCTDNDNHTGGDTPFVERAYEVKTFNNAFVHFFVGVVNQEAVILQTAPVEYIAYGAGPYANQRFVHVELCMYDDQDTFSIAYDAYCGILAKILYDRALDVIPAKSDGTGTLWSHADVTQFLGGTTHEDPIDYLNAHGISWDQHVENVRQRYNTMNPSVAQSPQTTKQAPLPSLSRFLSTTDTNSLYAQGKALGEMASTQYRDDLVILDFGLPYIQNNTYGTLLFSGFDAGNQFASTSEIGDAVKAYAKGYHDQIQLNNNKYSSQLVLAIGTNNKQGATSQHAQAWAALLDEVNIWIINQNYKEIQIAAASDMELDWNTAQNTRMWLDSYKAYFTSKQKSPITVYQYGDAAGCPPFGNCNNGWSQDDIWYVSWGSGFSAPLPEIFTNNSSQAKEWASLVKYSFAKDPLNPMIISGVMTQYQACLDQGGCSGTNNRPEEGWQQLWNALQEDSQTAQTLKNPNTLRWVTDITWEN